LALSGFSVMCPPPLRVRSAWPRFSTMRASGSTKPGTTWRRRCAEPHSGLVASLFGEHHRLRRARHDDPLVEAFRRADLTDVTAGLIAPGVSRTRYRALVAEYPADGFRPMLFKAFGRGLRESPLHPAPMVKF